MSPISHGTMYASAQRGIPIEAELRVLFLGQHVNGVVQSLDVVHDYLTDLGKTGVSMTIHTVVNNIDTTNSAHATIISLDVRDKAAILSYASDNNIDIIHDSDNLFTKKERFINREMFAVSNTFAELTVQLESYLTGNGIAWNFNEPTWHVNWIYKYSKHPGICSTCFELIGTGQEKNYSQKQMEFVRALANKTMHIEHAREQLYYFLQLKRRGFRSGNMTNDFNFELTYHLTNYSIYICSTMDILARLINDKYGLGYGRFDNYGISKTVFIEKLSAQRKTLADIFARKKFQAWADWMFIRRNHITHESNLYMTPMVIEKKNKLSDEELEKLVDAEFDWSLFGSVDVTGTRAAVKQSLELRHNYREVVTDMMTLERVDRITGKTQGYLVFPLRAIDEDYFRVSDIVMRAVQNVSHARN